MLKGRWDWSPPVPTRMDRTRPAGDASRQAKAARVSPGGGQSSKNDDQDGDGSDQTGHRRQIGLEQEHISLSARRLIQFGLALRP